MKMNRNDLLKTLRDVTDFASINHCTHGETCRGGTIWEVCSLCGMMWADDEGGKPADAHEIPEPIESAYQLIAMLEKA